MAVYEAYLHGTLTVSTTAVGLGDATLSAVATHPADQALISVVGGAIRFWTDGGIPTTSEGNVASDGSAIILESSGDVAHFRAIRDGADDVELSIQLYALAAGLR